MSHEVEGDQIDQKFKGYVFKISGGNDKQGFPMLQGVLTASRVRLLFEDGMKCYRIRKRGERKRKSVRGCIVSSDLSVINLVIVKKGEAEIEGVTDVTRPRRLGPKRANNIRKLFGLTKKDDVRQYVIRRKIEPKVVEKKEGDEGESSSAKPAAKVKKPYTKAPKIQRLITPQRLQRKRRLASVKQHRWEKSRKEAEEYNKLLSQRLKEKRTQRDSKLAKKRSLSRLQSGPEEKKEKKPVEKPAPAPKKEAPKKEAPKKEAPKKEAPKKEAPKQEAPKKEQPKKEQPKKEAPKKEAPKQEAPKKEAPKKEAPKKDGSQPKPDKKKK